MTLALGLVLGLVLAAAAALLLALPWWHPPFGAARHLRRGSANVASYRTRVQELEAESASGLLPVDAAQAVRAELDARLVADAAVPDDAAPPAAAGRSLGAVAGVGALLLAFAGTWYFVAGSWRTQALLDLHQRDPQAARAQAIAGMGERLEERVREVPDDADAWSWLGRLYREQERMPEAAEAFARANALTGDRDPELLIAEGEARLYLEGAGEVSPTERFERALALAPEEPRALWFSGLLAVHAGDAARALERWERLARQDLPDELRAGIEGRIAQLRKDSGLKAGAPAPPPAATGLALRVTVTVAPELAAEVREGDVLYVFAQPVTGPRMPLAVKRLPARLPQEVVLTDADGPMPTRKLSSVDQWQLVARVSRSGSAQGAPGDLEGSRTVRRADAAQRVELRIERRL